MNQATPVPEIIIANPHGFCGENGLFGVSGAIRIAQEAAADHPDQQVYILGELVHNPHVTKELAEKFQVQTVASLEEIPEGEILIIKSHGLPPATVIQAEARKLKIIDATCPMVKQVHQLVKVLAGQGKKIVYVASDLQHEEALGVYGEAPDNITLVTLKNLLDFEISEPENTVLLTQTTLSVLETKEAFEVLKEKYPTLTIQPHICPATTLRQQAVRDLAARVDLMIVVGAQNSSNSQRLFETARAANSKIPVYIIDSVTELEPAWFQNDQKPLEKIGLSSGASTPEWLLEQVVAEIKKLTSPQVTRK